MTISNPRVLVVDDDASNRQLLVDLVTREGYSSAVASGGQEALDVLERRRFDLVLLDIMMPEVDGLAVLTKLRQRGALPALPVVVVTAHEDRETRMAALAAGAVDFLSEPIDRLEVVSRIRSCIELGNLRETAVQAVEHALQESEHRLRLRFEQSPVATMDWDASFRVTDWNPAAEKLFGYRRSEVIGRHAAFTCPTVGAPMPMPSPS